jgi:hypothetical protein
MQYPWAAGQLVLIKCCVAASHINRRSEDDDRRNFRKERRRQSGLGPLHVACWSLSLVLILGAGNLASMRNGAYR